MDPDPAADPTTDPDLDAVAADLAAIETALDELAAGTYRHDTAGEPRSEPEPPGS